MNTSWGRLMQTSVTRGSSNIGRNGASVCVNEEAVSSARGIGMLGSRRGAKFIDRSKINVPRDDDLDTRALIDRDGRWDVDGVAEDVVDALLAALRVHDHRGAG